MREILNESILLEFIEGELSSAQAAELRARLADQPDILVRLELMRQDRAVLATDAEPALAIDLVAELEPLLAKPMLLGASPITQVRPGVYRARHRRSFSRRWRSLAMAAGFVLMTGTAALWGIIELTSLNGSDGDGRLALNGSDPVEPGGGGDARAMVDLADDGGGVIHHWIPSPDAIAMTAGSDRLDEVVESEAVRVALRSGAEAVESPVALVVRGDIADAVMQRLGALIEERRIRTSGGPHEMSGAIVRNFTYAEVEQAWREMVASSGLPQQQELIASMNGSGGFDSLSAQQRETVHRVARHSTIALGEHLAGDPALAATAEQQLRFTEAGAEHAITLRAADVVALLESLATEFGEVIELDRLESDNVADNAAGDDPLAAWRRWREAIGAINAALDGNRDDMIVLPVSIESAE